jgi:hypothetical protein
MDDGRINDRTVRLAGFHRHRIALLLEFGMPCKGGVGREIGHCQRIP